MWTLEYRGYFVQGYTNFDCCTITGFGHPLASKVYKSFRAAQLAITKYIKGQAK